MQILLLAEVIFLSPLHPILPHFRKFFAVQGIRWLKQQTPYRHLSVSNRTSASLEGRLFSLDIKDIVLYSPEEFLSKILWTATQFWEDQCEKKYKQANFSTKLMALQIQKYNTKQSAQRNNGPKQHSPSQQVHPNNRQLQACLVEFGAILSVIIEIDRETRTSISASPTS